MRQCSTIALIAALALAGCSADPNGLGAPPAEPDCQANLLECGGTCVDPQNDPAHCGACDVACAAGQFCHQGACVTGGCPTGQVLCGETCVDPLTDRAHCGAAGSCEGELAGTACPDGFVCDGTGTCALSCQAGLVACDGSCVNPVTSDQYCGASGDCQGGNAGVVCGPGTTCDGAGTCIPSCQPGFEVCGGSCTAIAVDHDNCGGCGNVCGAGLQCTDGVCCAAGERACNGVCVDVTSDEANCGACGTSCDALAFCSDGACTCPAFAQESCPGAEGQCINFLLDAQNCGACGMACATGEFCVFGECSPTDDQWIGELSANNCTVVDIDNIAGDDRGGVAVSGGYVFAVGDDQTARFASSDLTGGAPYALGGQNLPTDGLFSDPASGGLFSLGIGDAPLLNFNPQGQSIDALFVVDPDTGTLVQRIPLTPAIQLPSSHFGIFPGAGHLYLVDVDSGPQAPLYDVDLASGDVTSTPLDVSNLCVYFSENWADWGVAERIDGELHLAFRSCNGDEISRLKVSDGTLSTVSSFGGSINDLASFAIAPALNRWYFHHEGSSTVFGGTSETLGFCDATLCSDARCTP